MLIVAIREQTLVTLCEYGLIRVTLHHQLLCNEVYILWWFCYVYKTLLRDIFVCSNVISKSKCVNKKLCYRFYFTFRDGDVVSNFGSAGNIQCHSQRWRWSFVCVTWIGASAHLAVPRTNVAVRASRLECSMDSGAQEDSQMPVRGWGCQQLGGAAVHWLSWAGTGCQERTPVEVGVAEGCHKTPHRPHRPHRPPK